MNISKQQVEYIARLARLRLSDDEKEKLAREFSEILSYIEKLDKVDTENVEPMIGASENINILREDVVTREQGEKAHDKFVPLAPQHTDEYIETISPFINKR